MASCQPNIVHKSFRANLKEKGSVMSNLIGYWYGSSMMTNYA